MNGFLKLINKFSLIQQILIGLIIGITVSYFSPTVGKELGLLGMLFVGALKGIAPVLVFFLVIAAISKHKSGQETNMKSIIVLYLISTFVSSLAAVIASFLFPSTLHLVNVVETAAPPKGIGEVLFTVLGNIVDNPIHALMSANYIGILGWAVLFGLAFRSAIPNVKDLLDQIGQVCSQVVHWVIRCAPVGIMGLVAVTIAESGISSLMNYLQLLCVLLGTMLFIALIVNPLIAAIVLKRNPFPLVFKCLRESGVTAFFTRSSAANIPVNIDLAERLGVSQDTYSISIPLGSAINMGGAAITISIMTLAAVHTLAIPVDFPTAFLLSIIAAVGACGASGVAGGSLLLIPLACSLFGINNDIAMQVVGVGFIIGVLQDSTETALNSSTDVLWTAVADFAKRGYPADKV